MEVEATAAEAAERIVSELTSRARKTETLADGELDQVLNDSLPARHRIENDAKQCSSPPKIESISIQGVRSFGPEQLLRFSEQLTIVYGGNGKGKTSLTDAFELVTNGVTSRLESFPNAGLEVKDPDHIAHRRPDGTTDRACPPTIRIRFLDGERFEVCEWNKEGRTSPTIPDIQVLPRRLLRQLVNAKRTERTEPLGAALGLSQTIESWTEIAKILRNRAKEIDTEPEPYLQLLADELPANQPLRDALYDWQLKQDSSQPIEKSTPDPAPWQSLASGFASIKDADNFRSHPNEATQRLLTSFLETADVDELCPACEGTFVTEARLESVRKLLDEARDIEKSIALQQELTARCKDLEGTTHAWLTTETDQPGFPQLVTPEWRETVEELQVVLDSKDQSTRQDWCSRVATRLEELRNAQTEIAQMARESQTIARREAIAAARLDPDGTIRSIQERGFQELVVGPLLNRADDRIRERLKKTVDAEFQRLEAPINEWLAVLGPKGTPKISLEPVVTKFRPSLNLRVADYTKGSKPPHVAGHFSDAQIDMLGMSTHLAKIERDHPGSTIVIDDPSDMLDSEARRTFARDGVARLLDNENSPAHQLIILTHDDQLVRDLWDAHRDRSPATVQDTIEVCLNEEQTDRFSVFSSRSSAAAVERARILAKDFQQDHQDRLWFRSAFAAHTRQAAEMCSKDIFTLLGPAGLDFHSEKMKSHEGSDLGIVSREIRRTLRETISKWCSSGLHIPDRRRVDEILDLFSVELSRTLNTGAHADVVLPEAATVEKLLTRLEKIVDLLETPEGHLRSSWTTRSELAESLRSGVTCPNCNE